MVDDYDYERGVVGYFGVGEIRGQEKRKGGFQGKGERLPARGGRIGRRYVYMREEGRIRT